MAATNIWGIEIKSEGQDHRAWKHMLEPPFDPFVEEVECDKWKSLVLRSTAFDGVATPSAVNERAKSLIIRLSVSLSFNAWPLESGAVIEFVEGADPKRHVVIEAPPAVVRAWGSPSVLKVDVIDANGNIEPRPSSAQRWMQAAEINEAVMHAMHYLAGQPGWFELYNAYEVLNRYEPAKRAVSKTEKGRFTQTANTMYRHPPNEKEVPPPEPMSLPEAKVMIRGWIEAVVKEVSSKTR